eukprot:9481836-Pyramimonas_sp.AAC.1
MEVKANSSGMRDADGPPGVQDACWTPFWSQFGHPQCIEMDFETFVRQDCDVTGGRLDDENKNESRKAREDNDDEG